MLGFWENIVISRRNGYYADAKASGIWLLLRQPPFTLFGNLSGGFAFNSTPRLSECLWGSTKDLGKRTLFRSLWGFFPPDHLLWTLLMSFIYLYTHTAGRTHMRWELTWDIGDVRLVGYFSPRPSELVGIMLIPYIVIIICSLGPVYSSGSRVTLLAWNEIGGQNESTNPISHFFSSWWSDLMGWDVMWNDAMSCTPFSRSARSCDVHQTASPASQPARYSSVGLCSVLFSYRLGSVVAHLPFNVRVEWLMAVAFQMYKHQLYEYSRR